MRGQLRLQFWCARRAALPQSRKWPVPRRRLHAATARDVRAGLFHQVTDFSAREVAHFGAPSLITRVTNGDAIGTRFPAKGNHLEGRKRWILAETARNSKLTVDAGAATAITTHGKSLLPAGITAVEGEFERGQTVRIYHGDTEIARGLTQYAAVDLRRIMGKRSPAIADLLGYDYGSEAIHRDDMVLIARAEVRE